MEKNKKIFRTLLPMFLCFLLSFACVRTVPVYAEEEENSEEETEYIPEEYYDPIESNDLPGWPQGQAVQAASAVVMDLDTDTFLYSKNMYGKMYPASVTKIMTCMLALEMADLNEEVTFSEIVYDLEEGSSHQGIQPGEKLTMEQCLYGLMLESANDIANGLAEHLGGSISGFADMMNAKAEELGCVNTHFANPHGLHSEDHYTCAYDMALIAQAAYEIPKFREIVSTVQEYCPETNVTEEERYFVNHHKMLQTESEYYCSWCTGGKTGFTSDAWNTLVTYGEKDGMRLVCVLLRENGAGRAYLETTDLMNYGFQNFSHLTMESGIKEVTFYEAMKLNYLGKASELFQSDELKRETVKITETGTVTLPDGISENDLNTKSSDSGQNETIIYLYHDWPVGSFSMRIEPFMKKVKLPFEQKLDMDAILSQSSGVRDRSEIEQTAQVVWQGTQDFLHYSYTSARTFVENNTLTVIWAGSLILLVLVVLIIILVIRCTKEYRIQKRRRQEEKERLKQAEKIDQMTTAEIEQELRAAMEQERLRQEREAQREEERRREEEKLTETERILEEINKK